MSDYMPALPNPENKNSLYQDYRLSTPMISCGCCGNVFDSSKLSSDYVVNSLQLGAEIIDDIYSSANSSSSDDYSNNISTTGNLPINGSISGNIETANDVDWIKVQLVKDKYYQFNLKGAETSSGTLSDPKIVGLFDKDGNSLGYSDDDSGQGYNAQVGFKADRTGEYYISVQGYQDEIGTYTLSSKEIDISNISPIVGDNYDNNLNGTELPESIIGLAGNDYLYGEGGDDVLSGGAGDDYINGGAGNDTVYVSKSSGNDIYRDWAGENTIRFSDVASHEVTITRTSADGYQLNYGVDSSIQINGNVDIFWFTDGAQTASSYFFGKTMIYSGTAQGDYIKSTPGNDVIYGNAGDDDIYGGIGSDTLYGGEGNDNLTGGEGNDVLNGGSGVDRLYGGEGNDTYYIDNINDYIRDSGGNDTAYISVDGYKLSDSIENAIYTNGARALPYFIDSLASGSRWGEGIANEQSLTYSFALSNPDNKPDFQLYNDAEKVAVKNALASWAKVAGLTFTEATDSSDVNIRFFKDSSPSEDGAAGYAYYPNPSGSTVHIDISANMTSGDVNHLLVHEIGHTLGLKHPGNYNAGGGGAEGPYLPENEDSNDYTHMSYNGYEDGGPRMFDTASIHYLYGVNKSERTGDDTYSLDTRYIWDGDGSDTITASNVSENVSIDLRPGSWNFIGAKSTSILADNQSFLGFGTNMENAIGGQGDDLLRGNELNNSLRGGIGSDKLYGHAGNDVLSGGSGSDTLVGGSGNDTYYVDTSNDVVTEQYNEGYDVVKSSTSYRLSANVEALTLTGTAHTSGTGNNLSNKIIGNSGNNLIQSLGGGNTVYGNGGNDVIGGGSGNDSLYGGVGSDKLYGHAGNDVLSGGSGSDTLVGGSGNDTYYVDTVNDTVTEQADGGYDTIFSGTTYTASSYVEALRLMGSTNINATGNSEDNWITGNRGNNTILTYGGNNKAYGNEGNDVIGGGSGNDKLYGGADADTVYGHGGNDVLSGGHGSDTLNGGVGSDTLFGGLGSDTLIGSTGGDYLNGGDGADWLYGGSGSDTLVGGAGNDVFVFNTAIGTHVDTIKDFSLGDKIKLSDVIFSGVGGALTSSEFVIGSAANDSNDRIIYDKPTGDIYYDADGSGAGAAIKFATVIDDTVLTHASFIV